MHHWNNQLHVQCAVNGCLPITKWPLLLTRTMIDDVNVRHHARYLTCSFPYSVPVFSCEIDFEIIFLPRYTRFVCKAFFL